jgi:predicted nucleic acid-binding protein
MRRACVMDTSTLVSLTGLYELGVFSLLKNLFHRIHIPQAVFREYTDFAVHEPRRHVIIDRIRPNEGFLALCTRYDIVEFEILKTVKGIHEGEAEAAAQHRKVDSHYILSDDNRFKESIQRIDSGFRIISTLHLIAWLDLAGLISPSDRDKSLRAHHDRAPFGSAKLREAYRWTAKELSLDLPKERLNDQSSLKRLLAK